MENTIQSAEEFIQWAQHSFENETGEGGTQAEWMVAYAKEVAAAAYTAPSSIGEDEQEEVRQILANTCTKNETLSGIETTWNWIDQAKAVCDYFRSSLSERKIVLPSEKDHHEWESDLAESWVTGWNECLESIKRLNGIN